MYIAAKWLLEMSLKYMYRPYFQPLQRMEGLGQGYKHMYM